MGVSFSTRRADREHGYSATDTKIPVIFHSNMMSQGFTDHDCAALCPLGTHKADRI